MTDLIQLTVLGTYQTNIFDESAAEIPAYDPESRRAFVVNGDSDVIDVIDFTNPTNPVKVGEIDVTAFGAGANSVAVKNGLVAVAVEAEEGTAPGQAVFFDTDGNFLNAISVGVLPDMITFTPDGSKILTANEGEPLGDPGDADDPEGSVSVVDLSNGVENLTVANADFTGFNGQEADLRGRGVRIFPETTVAQDVEPEYIAVNSDSSKAFVTLQENNAVAIVDIATATVEEIQPLGVKDWSRGLPQLTQYPWDLSGEVLGTTPAGQEILLGGMSGLFFESQAGEILNFIATPDRGPNGAPTDVDGDGLRERPFPLPDYQAQLVRFSLDRSTGDIEITEQIFLTREDGVTPITGLPNLQAGNPGTAYTDEEPVDLLGNPLLNDPLGADLESIVVAPDGTFWLSDEYRPAIYHFDGNGVLIDRFIPAGTAAAAGQPEGTFGTEAIPEVYAQRRSNRGFEGMALDTDNGKLYAWIQSPLDNPDVSNDANSRSSQVLRILEFDPTTQETIGEYVYFLEGSPGVDKIGDAVYQGNGQFIVVERDSGTTMDSKKIVFEVDLTGATNVFGTELAMQTTENTLETLTADDLSALGIQAVTKTKLFNFPSIGYIAGDKTEGLALLPDGSIAVLNDNDFGLLDEEIPGDGSVALNPDPVQTVLGIVEFTGSNQLDVSDKDGAINLQNWPVFGLYQPDSIATFEVNGETYYVTANEGDNRGEDERIEDLTLDSTAFPNAEELQAEENLGRLGVSSIDGDLDGDGDFDQLFSYGTRSFSIFDSVGNLVFDSGGDFEEITATAFPDNFNANNDENDFDSRSDNAGPEPEGIAVGDVNGRTYAFIGLERMGGVMVYDVTEPASTEFVQYLNNRDFAGDAEAGTAGDLGPEGLTFVTAENSPTGRPALIVANEISGSTTIYDFGVGAVEGGASGETFIGANDANDLILANGGNDGVAGGLGDDAIFGGEGNDVLRGDLNERLSGTVGGNDKIFGGPGNDRISGKAGNDELYGDEGNDRIWGDQGDDLIRGGLGNDKLYGDAGNNTSGGLDTFVLAAGEGTDTILDFEVGLDLIGLAGGITVEELSISTMGSNTEISLGSDVLAVLQNVTVESPTLLGFSIV
ncbi:MAG: choice-of-anchor I family protein [Microcoleaceae cyanobacterium]